jgi:hypothetical protein
MKVSSLKNEEMPWSLRKLHFATLLQHQCYRSTVSRTCGDWTLSFLAPLPITVTPSGSSKDYYLAPCLRLPFRVHRGPGSNTSSIMHQMMTPNRRGSWTVRQLFILVLDISLNYSLVDGVASTDGIREPLGMFLSARSTFDFLLTVRCKFLCKERQAR